MSGDAVYSGAQIPSNEFWDILNGDEEDFGSECGELEELEDNQMWAEWSAIGETGDADAMEYKIDIGSKPIDSQDGEGNLHLTHEGTMASPESARGQRSQTPPGSLRRSVDAPASPASPQRDRSPLSRHSITPSPYSPLSSPRCSKGEVENARFFIDDIPEQATPEAAAAEEGKRGGGARVRGGVRGVRTRGSRPRGGNRGSGCRAADSAVFGESEWRRGERVFEVCLTDEDVPPRLREMVQNLEKARFERAQREMRRQNVRANKGDDSEDEFYDAESAMANDLFGGDASALKFDWSPMASFTGAAEEFQTKRTGPNRNISCAYDAFRQFWDDDILEHIVRETNRYAFELASSSESFARDWYETNVHEVLVLFAFWMMLGIIKMPTIKSCFSTNPLLRTDVFGSLMTEQRYWLLNRSLHFVDNSTRGSNSSKLFSLGPIVDHLNRKFQEAYTPGREISIDESLTLWKSNISFGQYIKEKAARYRIKTYELCETATGYLWSFSVYVGKDRETLPSILPKSTKVVVDLVKPLLNKGYRLFMDNWYNSPLLARFLKRNRTDCVGTLRQCRKNVPALLQLAKIPEGTFIARHSGDVVVMTYQDQNTVHMISTCHGTDVVPIEGKPGRPAQYKPALIDDYNKHMGGVDKKDRMLEPYLIKRKRCVKWYKKMFKRLLNVSVLNSRILLDGSAGDQVRTLVFRLDLVQQIMQRHLAQVPQPRQRQVSPIFDTQALAEVDRLDRSCQHFVVRTPTPDGPRTAGSSRNSKNRLCCTWCLVREKRHKRTVWMCNICEVPLCLEGCFQMYHTIQ